MFFRVVLGILAWSDMAARSAQQWLGKLWQLPRALHAGHLTVQHRLLHNVLLFIMWLSRHFDLFFNKMVVFFKAFSLTSNHSLVISVTVQHSWNGTSLLAAVVISLHCFGSHNITSDTAAFVMVLSSECLFTFYSCESKLLELIMKPHKAICIDYANDHEQVVEIIHNKFVSLNHISFVSLRLLRLTFILTGL